MFAIFGYSRIIFIELRRSSSADVDKLCFRATLDFDHK